MKTRRNILISINHSIVLYSQHNHTFFTATQLTPPSGNSTASLRQDCGGESAVRSLNPEYLRQSLPAPRSATYWSSPPPSSLYTSVRLRWWSWGRLNLAKPPHEAPTSLSLSLSSPPRRHTVPRHSGGKSSLLTCIEEGWRGARGLKVCEGRAAGRWSPRVALWRVPASATRARHPHRRHHRHRLRLPRHPPRPPPHLLPQLHDYSVAC
ncbi:hypothetical protein E2C01_011274 [Portunus trituberculatus]|uniref:Uncharacterized protein n=1 Tax=Portunus trituberculatus TaxID=210409 RepID=A0A5B7DAZ1_PORTR|nr:hypothetical protein [Portunus trituberculatus]